MNDCTPPGSSGWFFIRDRECRSSRYAKPKANGQNGPSGGTLPSRRQACQLLRRAMPVPEPPLGLRKTAGVGFGKLNSNLIELVLVPT